MTAYVRPLIEVDGLPSTAEELSHPALVNYGHFTAMHFGGAVRGRDLHLSRLRGAQRELFGSDLDTDWVRSLMRHATVQRPDAYLRVTVYEAVSGCLGS